ncbi:nitrilase-related carbon-nitrogen hydrolase [Geminicoccaceae bacterium 1502E]|nr:nitrilase-related carbon-nitrogen hydrolase [Geminicoccaceae bacterium 1502E]
MRIALWQAAGQPQERGERLAALRSAALEAADQGARLLLAPELGLVGEVAPRELAALAEPSDGEGPRVVGRIAAEAGLAILIGYPERCTGRTYSAALLVDRHGHSLASYRRSHVRPEEAQLVARGQWLTIVPFEGRRLGLLLGYDLAFPEAARGLVLSGADLLVAAGGGSSGDAHLLEVLLPARALENGVPLAWASHAGGEGAPSRVLGADGRPLVRLAEGPAVAVADLPPAAAAIDLRDRRPQLYQRLAMVDAVAGRAASLA